jgi:hypothetical protein
MEVSANRVTCCFLLMRVLFELQMSKDIFPRMVADGPRQAISLQDRLGSRNGARVKRWESNTLEAGGVQVLSWAFKSLQV